MFDTGASERLMGSSRQLGLPRRLSCVSRYENSRPCKSGSSVKSMPGTTFVGMKATCSTSAKKLSGTRLSVNLPMRRSGTSSSGMILVASRMSKSHLSAWLGVKICTPISHSG